MQNENENEKLYYGIGKNVLLWWVCHSQCNPITHRVYEPYCELYTQNISICLWLLLLLDIVHHVLLWVFSKYGRYVKVKKLVS